MASFPLETAVISASVFFISCRNTIRFFSLSSTARIRIPLSAISSFCFCLLLLSSTFSGSASRYGILTMNVVPFPISLYSFNVPSIASTSCITIARPRPRPSFLIFWALLPLSNASNILLLSASAIPIPVSLTTNCRKAFSSS